MSSSSAVNGLLLSRSGQGSQKERRLTFNPGECRRSQEKIGSKNGTRCAS